MDSLSELAEQLLRRQRHDFLNHLQVISSYLQLGKTERALEYMNRIAGDRAALDELLAELHRLDEAD